ncbi:MAG: hypothetical protein KIS86_00645 [Devosia sp.]|nr:hypothetical protein [Devosia sp.]
MTNAAHIRPLAAADIAAVAHLFQRQLRRSQRVPPPALSRYLEQLFVSGPFASAAMPSLVYERETGIAGFIGVTSQPMQVEGRDLKVAVCGALMVEGYQADPMAGARLLKAFLSGEQDIALSETAGDATLTMWRQLGGEVLSRHSLDWLRIVRPGGFAVETLERRVPGARLVSPLAHLADRIMRGSSARRSDLRWASLPDDLKTAANLDVEIISPDQYLDEVRQFTDGFAIRRQWSEPALAQLGEDLAHKSEHGQLRIGLLRAKGGRRLGSFVYYWRKGATARVLDVLARPAQAGMVIDALLGDAARLGAVAVRGRTSPALFDALLERRCLMFRHGASVISGRDKAVVDRFKQGDAAFNGVVGERWSRLLGDDFA